MKWADIWKELQPGICFAIDRRSIIFFVTDQLRITGGLKKEQTKGTAN